MLRRWWYCAAKAIFDSARYAWRHRRKIPAKHYLPARLPDPEPHRRGRTIQPPEILLDQDYLAGFGELRIPTNIWHVLERFDAWIEPALIAEWVRLMKSCAENQGRRLDDRVVGSAMAWSDPARDIALAPATSDQPAQVRYPVLCMDR